MCAFVVVGLVFPYQAKRLAWGTSPNDLFCVEWDVKPQVSQIVKGQGTVGGLPCLSSVLLSSLQCFDVVG